MIIQILGSGCKNCKKLYHNTLLTINELNIEASVTKVTDFSEIAEYNVMQMPALVVDGKIVAKGKVLTQDEIMRLLK